LTGFVLVKRFDYTTPTLSRPLKGGGDVPLNICLLISALVTPFCWSSRIMLSFC